MLVTLINVYSFGYHNPILFDCMCWFRYCSWMLQILLLFLFSLLQSNSIASKLTQTLKMMLKHTYAISMEILHQSLLSPLKNVTFCRWVFFVVKSGYHRRSIGFCIHLWGECLSCCENLYDYKVGIIMHQYYVILYKQFSLSCVVFLKSALSMDGNSISFSLFLLMELRPYRLIHSSIHAAFESVDGPLLFCSCEWFSIIFGRWRKIVATNIWLIR